MYHRNVCLKFLKKGKRHSAPGLGCPSCKRALPIKIVKEGFGLSHKYAVVCCHESKQFQNRTCLTFCFERLYACDVMSDNIFALDGRINHVGHVRMPAAQLNCCVALRYDRRHDEEAVVQCANLLRTASPVTSSSIGS